MNDKIDDKKKQQQQINKLLTNHKQVRAALMKSLGVYMSLRGNLDWIPRRHSMFSGAYGTAADTEQQCNNENSNR